MRENINTAKQVLGNLSIVDKAKALAWYRDVDFETPILVNVDKDGGGTERFRLTGATIEGVFAYPVSDFYSSADTDLLDCWCGCLHPWIERDSDSRELERWLDEQLTITGIDAENPLVDTGDFRFCADEVLFPGTADKQ